MSAAHMLGGGGGGAPLQKKFSDLVRLGVYFLSRFRIKIVFFKMININVSINVFKRYYLCVDRLMIYVDERFKHFPYE